MATKSLRSISSSLGTLAKYQLCFGLKSEPKYFMNCPSGYWGLSPSHRNPSWIYLCSTQFTFAIHWPFTNVAGGH